MKSLGPISFPILANTAYSFADTISRAGEIPTNLSLPLDTAQAGLFYKFKPSYISSWLPPPCWVYLLPGTGPRYSLLLSYTANPKGPAALLVPL